jgi:hypothetical protein
MPELWETSFSFPDSWTIVLIVIVHLGVSILLEIVTIDIVIIPHPQQARGRHISSPIPPPIPHPIPPRGFRLSAFVRPRT